MAEPDPPDFRLLPDDSFAADGPNEPDPGPQLSLRAKFAVVIVIAVLAASGVLVQSHRGRRPVTATGPQASSGRAWPAGADICHNPIAQPVIRSDPATGNTGIELSIGTNSLLFGNLDTGAVNPDIMLVGDTYLFDRAEAGGARYVELADCAAGNRIARVAADGQYQTVLADPLTNGLLPDGQGGVWAARFTDGGATMSEAKLQVILHRLDRPIEIPLGSLMFPLALRANLLYAEQQTAVGAGSHLVVFDLSRRRTVRDLGPFDSAEAEDGLLVWTPSHCTGTTPCAVDTLDLGSGERATCASILPSGFRVNGAAISPDHQRLAVAVPRGSSDPAYVSDGRPPSDVTVLQVGTGRVSTVPDVEIPPGGHIGLAFAADSERLVLAAGAEYETAFYLWAPGQPRPRATRLRLIGPLPTPTYLRAVG